MSDSLERLVGARGAYWRAAGRGRIAVRGSDRVRFLNGMISNELAGVPAGRAIYACQLDRKGHLLADLWAIVLEDMIVLDTAPGRAGVVVEMLQKHIIADDVELQDESGAYAALCLEGGLAAGAIGAPELTAGDVAAGDDGILWHAGGALSRDGVRGLGTPEALEERLRAAELPELTAEQREILRVEGFRAEFGVDMDERTFPAEARLDGSAVSFSKGCYVGQEIVARIESRGAVNRLLVQLEAEAPVEVGEEIAREGRALGSVTSAAVSPRRGPLAMGYVRSKAAEPGTELQIAGRPARIAGPPFAA